LADVVVPDRSEDVITPISPDYDFPSTLADQLRWPAAAGFSVSTSWERRDLAVMDGRPSPSRAAIVNASASRA